MLAIHSLLLASSRPASAMNTNITFMFENITSIVVVVVRSDWLQKLHRHSSYMSLLIKSLSIINGIGFQLVQHFATHITTLVWSLLRRRRASG